MMFRSIRSRLLLLLALVFLVVAVVAVGQALERREADTRFVLQGLTNQARFIAEQQRDAIRRTERFLALMTTSLDVAALAKDPNCAAKLQTYTHNDDYLANVFVANAQGRVICNPANVSAPPAISDRAYFSDALGSEDSIVGDPVYGRFSDRWVLPFSRRFVDSRGNVEGVVVAALDMGWVNKSFKDLALTSDMRLGLVTSKGIVLARQPDAEAWVGRNISDYPGYLKLIELEGSGSVEVASHDGQPRIYTFTPFAKTSGDTIYLWMTLPKAIVTAKADAGFRTALTVLGALMAVSFILAWYGGHRLLTRPIESIAYAARRIAKGELEVETGLAHGPDEIGQLALAFDEMSGQLARFDALTGLLNLHAFEAALASMIDDAARRSARCVVMRLQIKDFHHIEGPHGRAPGIAVIKLIGQRLQDALGNASVLARSGEYGFAVCSPAARSAVQLTKLMEGLQAAVEAAPLQIGERSIPVQLCFGVGFFPEDGQTVSELLQHTGVALGQALNDTSTRIRYYEQAMNDWLFKRSGRLVDLRRALKEQQFELHYQPQHDLQSGRLVGVEALVRWNHPEEGRIPPLEFIVLAEESGLIIPLGEWILERAVTQLVEWRNAHPDLLSLVMAVNVSAVQLASSEFATLLEQLLAKTGLPPENLELEITESQLMQFSSEPQKLIHRLKTTGVMLSIDDFGTGYSSLSYLKHFAVDKLKIDKSFVDNITLDPDDATIIEATIAMAHRLGLTVIAEGVESEEQADALRRLLCDEIQGYLMSRPLASGPALDYMSKVSGV